MAQRLVAQFLLHPHPHGLVDADDVLVVGHQHLVLVPVDVEVVLLLLLVVSSS